MLDRHLAIIEIRVSFQEFLRLSQRRDEVIAQLFRRPATARICNFRVLRRDQAVLRHEVAYGVWHKHIQHIERKFERRQHPLWKVANRNIHVRGTQPQHCGPPCSLHPDYFCDVTKIESLSQYHVIQYFSHRPLAWRRLVIHLPL